MFIILIYQLCIMFATMTKQVRTFTTTIAVLIIATVLSCSFVLSSLKLPTAYFHIVQTFLTLFLFYLLYVINSSLATCSVISFSLYSLHISLAIFIILVLLLHLLYPKLHHFLFLLGMRSPLYH